jgi:hypothetical protein
VVVLVSDIGYVDVAVAAFSAAGLPVAVFTGIVASFAAVSSLPASRESAVIVVAVVVVVVSFHGPL